MPRKPLYERLPLIWKRLDGKGSLERYLSVWDTAFDAAVVQIESLLHVRNASDIPDRHLKLLSIVGHAWRDSKTYVTNRVKIQHAIPTHSYKGTPARLLDTTKEAGSVYCDVQDNASRLMVIGKQGCIGTSDCVIMDGNFWHDGSFVLSVSNHTDWEELEYGMAQTIAAGELWWVVSTHQIDADFEVDISYRRITVHELDNVGDFAIGSGVIGESFWVGCERQGSITHNTIFNQFAVVGGLLTLESNMPLSQSILLTEGTATNPLSEENATIQGPPEITQL